MEVITRNFWSYLGGNAKIIVERGRKLELTGSL
jgi:hypothetical protein